MPEKLLKMPKFCANLSFMFGEKPFLERYEAAKNAGFKAVESGFPFGIDKQDVQTAKNSAGIQQILINVFTGDVTKGELGFAAIPGKETQFKESVEKTLDYAKAVGVTKMHIMAGKLDKEATKDNHNVYEKNLGTALEILEGTNIKAIIEPINKYSIPNYYLNNYELALEVIKKINNPNLLLMLDVFHLQQISGDIYHTIKKLMPYIGHVQIAQVPDRNEPDTDGEIDYKYVLKILEESGYDDWIGLEYKPAKESVAGLKWVKEYGYNL